MTETNSRNWYNETSSIFATIFERLLLTFQTLINGKLPEMNDEVSPMSDSQQSRDFRSIEMPKSRIGLASNEGELIVLLRKYLEIVGLVFFVWLLGYLHFSVSWILLAVFIYLFRQRQRSHFKHRHKMLSEINRNEEQFIKARLDELPSWVFFPDVERAEWLNRIIKQAWPYANQYLDKAIFREVMIPLIRGTSSALADFSFEKLDLGETPPRIGGVKVYTDNVRDQIMMDVEVSYAGDAHIKAKLKGIVCGIKDIQFVGDVRIILSPLINTIPLIGAVTYFFLKKPSIDFKLTDAGTLVDIPGLNDLMLAQINDIVASMMVLPNRQVFPLVSDLQIGHLRWSNPQGVVRVFVIQARDLIKADISLLGKGKSDPFVRVKAQGKANFKTKTINNTTNPEWNEVFEFVVEQYESDTIEFEVYDEDPGKDDFIGRAEFPLNALVDRQEAIDTWLTLKDVKKGSLNVGLQYFALKNQKSSLDVIERLNSSLMRREKVSKALLVCFIDRCTNLPRSKKTRREPNPFCRIKVDTTEDRTTGLESQTNPRFEHISHIFCSNPIQQKLSIEVCDSRVNNEVIAFYELPIKQIYDTENMTIETQAFPLRSLTEPLNNATILLRLSLLILSPGRSNERRSPSSPLSASPSADSLSNSTNNFGSDVLNQSFSRSSTTRASLEEVPSTKNSISTIARPTPPVVETSSSVMISDDPDLQSTRYGRVKLGIQYVMDRKVLFVTVFTCRDLINVHPQNLPDPYIRLYLIPDFKKDKRSTKSIHDTLHPVYGDRFEWTTSLVDVRRQRLFLSVKNNSPLFAQEQTYMGELQIDLSNIDHERNSIAWYALQEPNTSGAAILKIKYNAFENTDQQSTDL